MTVQDPVFVKSLAIGGYRSFNSTQRFVSFKKVNLLIGQNNCGKSNVLRFIHAVYPKLQGGREGMKLDALDYHLPSRPPFCVGTCISLEKSPEGGIPHFEEEVGKKFSTSPISGQLSKSILEVLQRKAKMEGDEKTVWFYYDKSLALDNSEWIEPFSILDDRKINRVWSHLTSKSGGSREAHWVPETLNAIRPKFSAVNTVMIPAIRKVGEKGTVSDDYSGLGIIEKLAKFQNPSVHNRSDREKFDLINRFLRYVTDNSTAEIEIPHDRDTILVHMNSRTLPLESLGTGIHEVIILASAATMLDGYVICMEEPELHLNPILQKKLVRYLQQSTRNQYFISTHSAALMDTPGAEIYHVGLCNEESKVERVSSDKHRSSVCEELGYHPSDLLQSNCIVWVEGPSDRIYLNNWIRKVDSELVEGINYSIMFYGGRLASHISGDDNDDFVDDFISLRRLNRRAVILIDSDKKNSHTRLNATKNRLVQEFNKGPGYAWVTAGREVENYLDPILIKKAILATTPSATPTSSFGRYDNTLSITTRGGKSSQASKVNVANYIVENHDIELGSYDLTKKVRTLVDFIHESNPSIQAAKT